MRKVRLMVKGHLVLITSDDMSPSSNMEDDSDVDITSCEHAKEYQPSKNTVPLTSSPVKSQIVIMSSQEMPPSSDESRNHRCCWNWSL